MIFERKFKGKKFLYTKLQEKIEFFLKKKIPKNNVHETNLVKFI